MPYKRLGCRSLGEHCELMRGAANREIFVNQKLAAHQIDGSDSGCKIDRVAARGRRNRLTERAGTSRSRAPRVGVAVDRERGRVSRARQA